MTPLLEAARRDRERLVLKPNDEYGGTGVMLGWEAIGGRLGRRRCSARWPIRPARGCCRSGSRCGARCFRISTSRAASTMRDMLVDLAPYLFRGRLAGYLTRLSATGLANVTSGGGQVPAFVVGVTTPNPNANSQRGSNEGTVVGVLRFEFGSWSGRSKSTLYNIRCFWPSSPDLMPGARNAVGTCLGIQGRRARGADRRRGERARWRPASRRRSRNAGRAPTRC